MTIEKAIEILKAEHEKAMKSEYIQNPVAYALYQTWRQADEEKRGKRK